MARQRTNEVYAVLSLVIVSFALIAIDWRASALVAAMAAIGAIAILRSAE
jgi:hypothetical protein